MNNLARSLGIPLDLDQAAALLSTGITRQIDAGRIRADEKSHVEYFLETGGTGLALVWPVGQSIKKGRWGKLLGQFSKIFEHAQADTTIELDDGQKIITNGGLVTVSNAPLFGVNNLIAPEAKMDDGLFDVAVYDNMTKIELSSYFLKTTNGKRAYNPNVRFYRARWVRLSCTQPFSSVSDKDELIDKKDLKIEVVPAALSMIVGQGAALSWPVDAVTAAPPLSGAQAAPKNGNNGNGNGNGNGATAPIEAVGEIVVHSQS
jgi:diacylglycerol kinase family enzyme